MDHTNRLVIPFVEILLRELECQVEAAVTQKIDRHDIIRETIRYKNGRKTIRYEDNDGRSLAFDERNGLQAISVVKKGKLIESPGGFDIGTSFEIELSFILAQVNSKDQSRIWQAMKVFKPSNYLSREIQDQTNGNSLISGKMTGQAEFEFSPATIAAKYLPDQADKVRERQLDLTAIEWRYKLQVLNVCTFCIEEKKD